MGLSMNRRVQLILLSAFVIATICAYAVYRIVGSHLVASQPKTTSVVVAASDIQLGSVLQDSDLGTVEIGGVLPEGAIVNKQQAIGRGVTSNLYKGEPILESRLAAPGAGGGLAATIPPGMRACAIRVDEVVGVAGFVTPGMRVDVLMSGNPPNSPNTEGPRVKTLLQNIEVLSAGTDIQKDSEGKPQPVQVVNLLVTPEQAEELSLAASQAKIQLVLRNPLDTQTADTPGTAVGNLYADKSAPPPPKERPVAAAPTPHVEAKPKSQVYVIQVFNGSKQSEAKFATDEEKP
jgi:pilus assembly protein CpaB